MTTKSQGLIKVFLTLSDVEKAEVKEFIDNHQRSNSLQKGEQTRNFNESFKRIMGPVSQNACPLCGK